jgi:phosphate transport system permease protein
MLPDSWQDFMEPKKTYTRRARASRKTKLSVWITEIVARYLITAGGIGTIAAVITVFLFLLYVVAPLFSSASITNQGRAEIDWSKAAPVQMGMDEDQLMCWAMFPNGSLDVVRLDTGELLEKRDLFAGKRLTATSFTPGEETAFGFEDGTLRMGKIGFATTFVQPDDLPDNIRALAAGEAARWKKGMVLKTPQGQYRHQTFSVLMKEPVETDKPSPVVLIDQSKASSGRVNVVLTADGKLRLNKVEEQRNLITGQITFEVSAIDLPYKEPAGKGPPMRLFLSAQGDQIYLFWKDGHLIRIDARDDAKPVVAEVRNVLDNPSLQITDVRCLIGKGTMLVGDSSGRVRAWFYAPSNEGVVAAHEFAGTGAAATAIAVSDRSRSAAVAYANGKVRLFFVTSERLMAEFDLANETPTSLVLARKFDGLAVSSAKGVWHWSFDPGHPEITVKSLFSKIWYETGDQPEYKWQSSGTGSFEPKMSLVPLIFGTLKSSIYSLLFGVPLALLGAIYTSEFLHPRAKAVVKPAIEMMASLPSVVLGYLAGLVFAEFVAGERVLPAVMACCLTVPLSFLVGAHLWQLIPDRIAQIMSRWRFLFICVVLPLGLLSALPMGQVLQQLLFEGNLREWIDGKEGSSIGGWVFLLVPLSGGVCLFLMGRYVNPWLRSKTVGIGRFNTALVELGKFLLGGLLTLLFAWFFAMMFSWLGLDTRASVFAGAYSQRNSLVVGFAMAFAIIPIIYTIAEDALSSVPEHLRAGSLAAGATRWQTAVRIVIPTAMSGLFSAVMIGMGRAVGETMIVLMATGNTPVMDWSIFTGFRTLAANIAVELPEAVPNSSHFRVLFLAALSLFAITFVINTAAEIVRMRFRRRAYQL